MFSQKNGINKDSIFFLYKMGGEGGEDNSRLSLRPTHHHPPTNEKKKKILELKNFIPT